MILGLQPIHILIIIVVAVLVFGASRLPELGRGFGRSISEFKKGVKEMPSEIQEGMNEASPTSGTVKQASSTAAVSGGNFCPNCGVNNMIGAKFCNKCGASLPVSQS